MKLSWSACCRWGCLFLAVAWLGVAAAQAGVSLLGQAALVEALKNQPPCCVIDARGENSRRKQPLPDALRYRPDLNIVVSASVIVVADRDQEASKVGAALAKKHPGKTIYAVKGGAAVWQSVLKTLAGESSSGMPAEGSIIRFVIPHNTCETGTPLQILDSQPKK